MRWLTGLLASATAAAVVIVTVCAVAASVGGTASPRPASAHTHPYRVTPVYGEPGDHVTVLGHRFSPYSTVYVAGKPVTTTFESPGELSITVPEGKYAQADISVHTGTKVAWIGLFTYGTIADVPPMNDTVVPSAPSSESAESSAPAEPVVATSAPASAVRCDGIHDEADAIRQRGKAVAYATVVVGPVEETSSKGEARLPVAHVWLLAGKLSNGPLTYLSEQLGGADLPYTTPGTYSMLLSKGSEPGVYTPTGGVAGTFSQTVGPRGHYVLVERCQPAETGFSVLTQPDTDGINAAKLLTMFRTALHPTAQRGHVSDATSRNKPRQSLRRR